MSNPNTQKSAIVWQIIKDVETDERVRFLGEIYRKVFNELVDADEKQVRWKPFWRERS